VSFNYDRVVESLRDALNADESRVPCQIKVIAPDETGDPEAWQGCIPVLKLHGSVDWRKHVAPLGGIAIMLQSDPRFALACRDEELAIATPGPSKMREAQATFRELWTLAKNALRTANAIVFVGFRFPETDAYAREELLGAIGENVPPASLNTLRTHVVLGVDQPIDSDRLVALLHLASRNRRDACQSRGDHGFTVDRHPLYAQDFLTVAKRADLFVA
jgi:hypothetical protein